MPAKSLTLRVTSVRPCSRAVAAIIPSATPRGWPTACRRPSRTPQRSATACVTGSTRLPNQSGTLISINCSYSARFAPCARSVVPLRISPMVSTLTNGRSLLWLVNHATSLGPAAHVRSSVRADRGIAAEHSVNLLIRKQTANGFEQLDEIFRRRGRRRRLDIFLVEGVQGFFDRIVRVVEAAPHRPSSSRVP